MSKGYEALHYGAAWMDLSGRGRILVRGRDRARLLHNICSNDVKTMTPGTGCYAFLLNPQGRIQADMHLLCLEDRFLIDTEPELRERVPGLIQRYIIADQVTLEDASASITAIAVEGPGAESIQSAPPSHGAPAGHSAPAGHGASAIPAIEMFRAPFSLTGQPGYRIYCAAEKKAEVIEQLESAGAQFASAEDARIVRIENGKPRYGEDIDDTSLVQETRQMQAVSFRKGCYIGQEIVERVRSQGHVNKKLVSVEMEAVAPPAPATRLTSAGAEVGRVTSAAFSPAAGKVLALAIVRSEFAAAGTEFDGGRVV